MLHYVPAFIMFMFTVGFASLFLLPAIKFQPKNELVGFYWRGLWMFLAAICAVAGASNTLLLANFPAENVSQAFSVAIIVSFVFFIVFAWFRLAGKAALHLVQKFLRRTA